MDFDVRRAKLRMKRNFFLFSLLLSLLIGWVTVMLVFPWLERTFSDPTLSVLVFAGLAQRIARPLPC